MVKPLVSVIIPKTEKEDISLILEAIKGSSYTNIEVIVVQEGLERSAQRNIGIKRAKGEYLLILDADQVPGIFLIEDCVKKMKPGVMGIYIPEEIPGDSFFNKIRNFERQFYTATPVDVVRFVRKDCPLFDETMSGPEDSDWDRKFCKVTSSNRLYHFDHVGLKSYIRKKSYYSKSMRKYHELHPDDLVLKLWYRCFWIFIEHGKWKKIIQHPVLFLGVLGIITIRGLIWLRCR